MVMLSTNRKSASLALTVVSILAFFLTFLHASQLGLDDSEPSNRVRFHAFPVAISQLYHDRVHDYTANWSIAMDFHGSKETTQALIKKHAEMQPPTIDGDYYWTADDRGFSDFVYAAFSLFGPDVTSLFYFWFLLLGLSLVLALIRFFNDLPALICMVTAIIGIGASIPIYNRAVNQFSFAESSVHISESRMLGVLGMVALLHTLLSISRSPNTVPAWLNLGTLIFQVGLVIFLLHTRSTILWVFLTILISSVGVFAYRLVFVGPERNLRMPLAVTIITISAFAGIKAYQAYMYNPAYFSEIGPRTVWHNAIMGTAYSPVISKVLKTDTIDDGRAVDAVLRDMKQRKDGRLTDEWERQNILNSLGSHSRFDWATYEEIAKELYLRTLLENPVAAVKMFLWDKPAAVINVLWCSNLNMPFGCYHNAAEIDRPDQSVSDVRHSFWSIIWLVMSVLAAGILFNRHKKVSELSEDLKLLSRQMAFPVMVAAFVSMLPGYLFYPSTASTAGATAMILTIAYFIILLISFSVFVRLRGMHK